MGSWCRIRFIKSTISLGTGFMNWVSSWAFCMSSIVSMMVSHSNGSLPVMIWYKTTPRDQISTKYIIWSSYTFFIVTSTKKRLRWLVEDIACSSPHISNRSGFMDVELLGYTKVYQLYFALALMLFMAILIGEVDKNVVWLDVSVSHSHHVKVVDCSE